MNIGERQTVQHAKHPTLGEGRLVYDNGPAFFIADSGEIERYDEAGWLGEPKHKKARASKVPLEARRPWVTKESVGGHHFTFRRESDPAPHEKPARKKTEQAEMFK